MTTFKKGINVKTRQELIACIEEKAIFMATMDGKIYKQFPRQHFKEEQFKESVKFPGDYIKARSEFNESGERKRKEQEETKRIEAEKNRKHWAEERKKEVMTTRKVRNLAFCGSNVIVYKVAATDMEFGCDGQWYPQITTLVGDTKKIFFDQTEAESYYNQLKSMKPCGKCPIQIDWMEAELESDEILGITNHESLKELIEDADFDFKEDYVVWPEYKSVEGSVIVVWAWDTHVGYAREFKELRLGRYDETEEDLITGNEDRIFRPNLEVVLEAEEVEGLTKEELKDKLEDALLGDWKWRNPTSVGNAIEELIENLI